MPFRHQRIQIDHLDMLDNDFGVSLACLKGNSESWDMSREGTFPEHVSGFVVWLRTQKGNVGSENTYIVKRF